MFLDVVDSRICARLCEQRGRIQVRPVGGVCFFLSHLPDIVNPAAPTNPSSCVASKRCRLPNLAALDRRRVRLQASRAAEPRCIPT